MYMLIFGWLKVADILSNPFGNDIYDINLASTLDLNIWKASITLENQDRTFTSSFLRNPYLEEKSKIQNHLVAQPVSLFQQKPDNFKYLKI